MNGETYVVHVNEFSAMCNWQVVGVQVEQNRCKDRALRKAVTLVSPRTGVMAHVHPETSISKQQTHQSGEPIRHASTQFVKKTTVQLKRHDLARYISGHCGNKIHASMRLAYPTSDAYWLICHRCQSVYRHINNVCLFALCLRSILLHRSSRPECKYVVFISRVAG